MLKLLSALFSCLLLFPELCAGESWKRHTIDATSVGADGARLMDVNGDGRTDLVTPWEEGGLIRAYLHPGSAKVSLPWPSVTVGQVRSPEDAVFVDLDNDGNVDVVSCCEGAQRCVFVHWAPVREEDYLAASQWKTQQIPCTAGKQMWMFAVASQVDKKDGIDLILGSKGDGASISWLQAPQDPRDLDTWKLHRVIDAGWIMSLRLVDMNADRKLDLLLSDRKGMARGVKWLEIPKNPVSDAWQEQRIGGSENEVMFLDIDDLDGDHEHEVIVATQQAKMLVFSQKSLNGKPSGQWTELDIPNPNSLPNGKGVVVGDLDLDGRNDIVHTTEPGGEQSLSGVSWLKQHRKDRRATWTAFDISGPDGIKFDLVRLADLDQDGDLDVITCEERHNLGVIWYENPAK